MSGCVLLWLFGLQVVLVGKDLLLFRTFGVLRVFGEGREEFVQGVQVASSVLVVKGCAF